MINPAKVGAIAGAKIIAKPIRPMTLPLFSIGKTISMTLIISGVMIAAPAAWIMRPISKTLKFGDTAQITVPINKNNVELTNNCLVVNRLIKYAVTGINTPFTSIKPVASHWTVVAET
ncbi:hypothetical protein GCM10008915_20580 [Bifidobacterium pullorum subsp. gallinarum]